MNTQLLAQAANEARGLAMDAIHSCNSGHLGLPLGAADIGAVLFGHSLNYCPTQPKWLNRDRFILSAGHGSMFIYSWLHLAGYNVSLADIKNFRKIHSITPGHPEFRETPGIEATTGPLGQGVANAVGYALSGKRAAARFNTPTHTIFNHHVFALMGDGCLQEGIAREAIAFAGHHGLDNLVLIYDANDVTLDAPASVTQSENVEQFFHSQHWNATTIDGHDLVAIGNAIHDAKTRANGKPSVIIAKTIIAKGVPEVAGTAKGHGEGGAKFAEAAKPGLGLPADQPFFVSEQTRSYFAQKATAATQAYQAWLATFEDWTTAFPELAAELDACLLKSVPADLSSHIPEFPADYHDATRSAGASVLNALANTLPQVLTGSADLFGSTKNYIKNGGDFSKSNLLGRNIWFGIREHAMAAITNGIVYDGLFAPSCATFLVFADYLRPAIRVAALSNLPVTYIFTHDSIAVGEDGPTHQPVETVSGLRVIPNLDVIRPADAEETAGAFIAATTRQDGPTALILTRQVVPSTPGLTAQARRDGVLKGAYIAKQETGPLSTILIASGSELQHALAAADSLGEGVRVVSMPCFEIFDRQSAEYRDSILPPRCTHRLAIEAGVTGLWWKYVGTAGKVLGIDRFGFSAPGDVVMKELGMTQNHILKALQ